MNILAAPSSAAWVEAACERWPEVLIDHANCEKKAASSALALMFAYPEDQLLTAALSRVAREELRHFEQVSQLMRQLQVPFERMKPARYAAGLRAAMRSHEPLRKLDLLLASALIEARSCERFALLAPRLAAPLGGFYQRLQRTEARHCQLFLRLARTAGGRAEPLERRLGELAAVEAELITAADEPLRFHAGPPRAAAARD
jgi:tRNA-(ms[2]io[6]A)-hydroxylase